MMSEVQLDCTIEDKFIGHLFSLFAPPERLSTKEYAETYRWLTNEVSAFDGKMDCMRTPYMLYPMECLDNIDIKTLVAKKSAQIGWSEIQNNYISKCMDINPQNMIMAFPREATAKSYSNEKIRPMIKNSPRLTKLIGDPDKCSFSFYKFPGGFLKLVSAGSVTALKSTAAPILIIEEPDDLKEDLKGQGDALGIFIERQKSFMERKLIYGGTPSEEGFSKVDVAYKNSNQMRYFVPCEKCGNTHVLDFDNLHYDTWPNGQIDKIYGIHNPETAYYRCPHCSDIWDDDKKNLMILKAIDNYNLGWKATNDSDIYGFAFNELLSNFPGSTLVALAKKEIIANIEASQGKDGKLKVFVNNSKGEVYRPQSTNTTIEKLKAARINYEELVVPANGLILTAGIDVQHNRFAIVIRAWGRNGNSWLVHFGEIYGYTKDPEDEVWKALTRLCLRKIPSIFSTEENPVSIPISAISIDSGDGGTTQLVYNWVRKMYKNLKYVYATKGSSNLGSHREEIFQVPPGTPSTKYKTLAESSGVKVYIIGVQKAKDEVLRKLGLTGNKDRSYHYKGCREDYEEQLLSNKKRISPLGDKIRYELVFGQRDEALDCEVMALHAARALHLHLWEEKQWKVAEELILIKRILDTKLPATGNVTSGLDL